MKRYLEDQIRSDLTRKMVFVGGARQVGKTTLAQSLIEQQSEYLNWDIPDHRHAILQQKLPDTNLWVFDEIHKYTQWRNFLKGLYDQQKALRTMRRILVTGSARLDFYRHGGDSLQGRYHYMRLHPLSVAELDLKSQPELTDLLRLGGFPEPYLGGSEDEARRWSREYRVRLIEEDIRSLENLKDLGSLELLTHRLPALVGSPLSVNGLREDLQVSHKTLENWLTVLERFYTIFRLSSFGAPAIRAVKKMRKHYHSDWTLVADESARLENLVACHLLKWVHFQQDTLGQETALQYFRDLEDREIDFVITENGIPIQGVEVKLSETTLSKPLIYFSKKFPTCQMFQIHLQGDQDAVGPQGIRIMPVLTYLQTLV